METSPMPDFRNGVAVGDLADGGMVVGAVDADDAPPVDRPNLSKDFLAGTAPEDWLPLRAAEFYTDRDIELVQGARVTSLDVAGKRVLLQDGRSRAYGALLIATGADPVHLDI